MVMQSTTNLLQGHPVGRANDESFGICHDFSPATRTLPMQQSDWSEKLHPPYKRKN